MTGSLTAQRDDPLAVFEKFLPEAAEEGFALEERQRAFQALRTCGLPHRKVEAWKYTDPSGAVAGPFERPHHCGYGLIAPDNVRVGMIRKFPDIGKEHPFALLSHALSHGGLEIVVPPDVVVEEPVQVRLPVVRPGGLLCPALKLYVGSGSKVDVIFRSEGQGEGSLVSQVTQVMVGRNAQVSFTRLRSGRGADFHLLQTRQASGSQLTLFDSTTGGELTRSDLHATLDGERAEIDLHGLYLLNGEGHVDNHTSVVHAVPNTASRQLYKGILDDKAAGVFNGRIVVEPGAHGTDALQVNRNLLRARSAKIDTKPQLEIANDDVRCTHGATIGQLDEAAVFYLQSRGMARDEAVALLARGFAGEVLDLAPVAAREILIEQTGEWFGLAT